MLGRIYYYVQERLDAVIWRIAPYFDRLTFDLPAAYRPVFRPVSWRASEPPRESAPPLEAPDHWGRASGAITAAISGLERVQEFQFTATRQLDAAEYALQHLIEELSAVMPMPLQVADGAPLRAVLAKAARQPAAVASKAIAA
jgi:hypothetical protein